MIGHFLSGDAEAFVVFLIVTGVIWLWNLWDCLRHPERPPPLRWYHFTNAPPEDRWDLRVLNHGPVEPAAESEAGTKPGHCNR